MHHALADTVPLLFALRLSRHDARLIATLNLLLSMNPMFSHSPFVSWTCTRALKIWRTPSFFATLSLPLHQHPNPVMGKCRFCGRVVAGSLRRHFAQCGPKSLVIKRSPPPHRGRSTLSKGAIHLQISTKHMSSQLAGDTHFATHTRPSTLLHSKPSLRERAQLQSSLPVPPPTQPQSTSTLQEDHLGTDVEFEMNDSPRSFPDSPAFPDVPAQAQVNEPDADFAFMQQFAPFIDPDAEDPFAPSKFCDEYMTYVPPRSKFTGTLPTSLIAQIDLFRILMRSGCSLAMHDQILSWVVHYSQLEPGGKLWTSSRMLSRSNLVRKIASLYDMSGQEPVIKTVESPYNGRQISVPVFSFFDQAVSLLSSELVTSENLIDGYDLFTGLCGEQFWDPATIDASDTMAVPTPVDPKRKVSDIHSSYLFQSAVSRFCTKPNHVPVPVIIGYDKANLSRQGDLAIAPLIFTFVFFKSRWRHKSSFWRIFGYVPNLSVGVDKNQTADEKAIEHHLCLGAILKDFEEICAKGGFKTTINGKEAVLKFFIQYIVGDAEGHDDLSGHFRKNEDRSCLCPREWLCSFVPGQCIPLTMTNILDTRGKKDALRSISQRYRVPNAFYRLPFADRMMGVAGACTWEAMHAIELGLIEYQIESFHDILGEKKAGAAQKKMFNKYFLAISAYMNQQSETDFPRRSSRTDVLANANMTAKEKTGNHVVFLLCFHTKDLRVSLQSWFDKYNLNNSAARGKPTISGCAEAIESLLCLEKWIMEEKPVGEVMSANKRVAEVLSLNKKRFPRRENSQQWNLKKMHGTFKMATSQQLRHGCGQGWDSAHTERMHQHFFTRIGRLTQRRLASFAKQVACRHHENMILDECINDFEHKMIPLGPERYSGAMEDKFMFFDKSTEVREDMMSTITTVPSLDYHQESLPKVPEWTGSGKYSMSFNVVEFDVNDFWPRWDHHDGNAANKPLHPELLYALLLHAKAKNWSGATEMEGYTSVKKMDPTTQQPCRYRSDALFHGASVKHWALFTFEDRHRRNGTLNAGMIFGFVRFTNRDDASKQLHVVARCTPDYHNFNKKFMTHIQLLAGDTSIYFIPIQDMIGPLCVVPNVHNDYRMTQDQESWMAVKPRRKWGRHFGDTIVWEK